MGYRSDVRVVISSPKMPELYAEFFLLQPSNQQKLTEICKMAEECLLTQNYFSFYIPWVKWWNNIIVDFYNYCEEKCNLDKEDYYELNGAFVRLGEEMNDIEHKYFGKGYQLAYPGRHIETDLPDDLGERIG